MDERKPILLIDFDGVLHSYQSGWKGARCIPDPPVDGALEFLVAALEVFDIQIYSSRSRQWGGKRAMKKWLKREYKNIGDRDVKEIPKWWLNLIRNPSAAANFVVALSTSPLLNRTTMEPWEVEVEKGISRFLKKIQFPTKKPAAFLTIDDRAFQFKGIFPNPQDIRNFKPWNKKGG